MTTQELEARKAQKRAERAELLFPMTDVIEEGVPRLIAPDVYLVKMPLKMALSHINVYLLKDSDGWYIIDSGLPNEATKNYWRALAAGFLVGKTVKGIICTHFHYDHAGLAPFLAELFQAPVWMTLGEYYTLRSLAVEDRDHRIAAQSEFLKNQGMPSDIVSKVADYCAADPFVSFVPREFRRLHEGLTFKIGIRTWTVKIGRGHSPEHACLYSIDEQPLLIAGDQVLPDISSNVFVADTEPEADSLTDWLTSLLALKTLPADILVLPSHGQVFKHLHARVNQLVAHHQRMLDTLLLHANLVSSFNAYQAMCWMFPYIKSGVDIMLAQSETLAHLNYLCTNNKIKRVRQHGQAARYMRCTSGDQA